MEIVLQQTSDLPSIESYAQGCLQVNGVAYHHGVLINQNITPLPKDLNIDQLTLADFQAAIDNGAEVLIVGTGQKQQFLPAQLMAQVAQYGIGIECMNTDSACRTIMMLQSEGRQVWAWLWLA